LHPEASFSKHLENAAAIDQEVLQPGLIEEKQWKVEEAPRIPAYCTN